MNISIRFWSHVTKTTGCWLWNGTASPYGNFRVGSRTDGTRRLIKAHIFSFEEKYGKVPEGKLVCHKCDNPICVRPSHLFAGTPHDNNMDMCKKGRQRKTAIEKEIVKKIFYLHTQRVPQTEIAEALGVHKQNVWNILHRSSSVVRAAVS